ncbi:MAG: AgmX/PglI C-terminal domain-containing protein [Pseudomonadota bacterium]
MNAAVRPPDLLMPWESSGEDDARFKKLLRRMFIVFAILAIAMPLLPIPEIMQEQPEKDPQHLARVILEKQALPEPKPVIPKPKPKPEPKPEPVKPEPVKPEPVAKIEPVKPVPVKKPELSAEAKLAQARDKAAVAGVLAFQDDLSAMRDSLDLDAMPQTVTSRGEASAAKTERAMITDKAAANSGGINTAELSRDTGGPALSGRQTTQVESGIAETVAKESNGESARLGGRSDDSIRQVMDRNKGSIFAIYNRALRQDPLLEGKLVFEMLINASGTVEEITLLSSDLNDAALTQKILSRIQMIRFEPEDVITTRVNYSFDFLPYS